MPKKIAWTQQQVDCVTIGLAISDKKIFCGRCNRWNNWFVLVEFRLLRGTENSQNFVPNHSTEEKTIPNSIPWNKNRSKHLEFCSEPFPGRENNMEFRSIEQKTKLALGIPF
jgi:hypothetical protein